MNFKLIKVKREILTIIARDIVEPLCTTSLKSGMFKISLSFEMMGLRFGEMM